MFSKFLTDFRNAKKDTRNDFRNFEIFQFSFDLFLWVDDNDNGNDDDDDDGKENDDDDDDEDEDEDEDEDSDNENENVHNEDDEKIFWMKKIMYIFLYNRNRVILFRSFQLRPAV